MYPKPGIKWHAELVAAEIAGGDVPDLIESGGAQIVTLCTIMAL